VTTVHLTAVSAVADRPCRETSRNLTDAGSGTWLSLSQNDQPFVNLR